MLTKSIVTTYHSSFTLSNRELILTLVSGINNTLCIRSPQPFDGEPSFIVTREDLLILSEKFKELYDNGEGITINHIELNEEAEVSPILWDV